VPALPVTVESVEPMGAGLVGVSLVLADGTRYNVVIPDNLATLEGVRISALAVAQLLDPAIWAPGAHHKGHRRYDPRNR